MVNMSKFILITFLFLNSNQLSNFDSKLEDIQALINNQKIIQSPNLSLSLLKIFYTC